MYSKKALSVANVTSARSIHVPNLRLHDQSRDIIAAMQPWLLPRIRHREQRQSFVWTLVNLVILTLLALIRPSNAVYVEFENCLGPNIINTASQSQPLLQYTPYHVWASFNDSAPSHTLNITVYGNISGIATREELPPWNDTKWLDDNETLGKILDQDRVNNKFSTLFARFNVLHYTPYDAPPSRFCENTIHQACPLIPAFNLTGNMYVALCLTLTQLER